MFQSLPRPSRRFLLILLSIFVPLYFEAFLHWRSFAILRPQDDLDAPFYSTCQEPNVEGQRENGVLVMLARNSEINEAKATVTSVEDKFNRWFHYPYVFFNDEQWDPEFIRVLNDSTSGEAKFEVIPQRDWSFPEWMDVDAAKASIVKQGEDGVHYGGLEGYHHMCRFFSGKFYTQKALRPYKWYWRLEPNVEFSCSITYDPFIEMAKHKKVYGWTLSLWEEGNTCPSLFRQMADWKENKMIATNNLWKSMMDASWFPYPFRQWLYWLPHHDKYGDAWSKCHYWSNFEIASLDFFRSKKYQDLFEYLDQKEGFYQERWGDAAVHSLAVGMLVEPSRVHHFADIGYRHGSLYQCPANAPGGQLEGSVALGDALYSLEREGGIGCRCTCDGSKTQNFPGYCANKLKQPNRPDRPWLTWFL